MSCEWPMREVPEQVGPVVLTPGSATRATLRAGLADIPLIVYAGTAPGPVLYMQALQHGLELNGVEVMRRLVCYLAPQDIHGALVLVPMANTLAARTRLQSFPYPDQPTQRLVNDMNRRWRQPLGGSNHVDQVVAALGPLVRLADGMVDLHCHELLYPALALTDMNDPRCRDMGLSMGFDVVHHSLGTEGMFGRYCMDTLGKPCVTVEMPPLRRVDRRFSDMGFRGVVNLLRHIGMLDGDLDLPEQTAIFGIGDGRSVSVTAEAEGYMARYVEGGARVAAGDLAAEIWCPGTFEPVQAIRAPFDGFVSSIGRPPQMWGEPEYDFISVGERAVIFSTPGQVVCPATELASGTRVPEALQEGIHHDL